MTDVLGEGLSPSPLKSAKISGGHAPGISGCYCCRMVRRRLRRKDKFQEEATGVGVLELDHWLKPQTAPVPVLKVHVIPLLQKKADGKLNRTGRGLSQSGNSFLQPGFSFPKETTCTLPPKTANGNEGPAQQNIYTSAGATRIQRRGGGERGGVKTVYKLDFHGQT